MDLDMNGCLSSIFAWEILGKVGRREENLCGQILNEFQLGKMSNVYVQLEDKQQKVGKTNEDLAQFEGLKDR